jgi:hypothetical protein
MAQFLQIKIRLMAHFKKISDKGYLVIWGDHINRLFNSFPDQYCYSINLPKIDA